MRVTHVPGTLEMLAGDCPPGAGRGGRIVTDWLSSIDGLLSGALPAADPSGLNLAISFEILPTLF
jgi:hypothetical protein